MPILGSRWMRFSSPRVNWIFPILAFPYTWKITLVRLHQLNTLTHTPDKKGGGDTEPSFIIVISSPLPSRSPQIDSHAFLPNPFLFNNSIYQITSHVCNGIDSISFLTLVQPGATYQMKQGYRYYIRCVIMTPYPQHSLRKKWRSWPKR
jgi:hypothetical protein